LNETRNSPLGFILTLYLEPFKQDHLNVLAALGKTPLFKGTKFFAYVHKPFKCQAIKPGLIMVAVYTVARQFYKPVPFNVIAGRTYPFLAV
jgi:hypothetical protein